MKYRIVGVVLMLVMYASAKTFIGHEPKSVLWAWIAAAALAVCLPVFWRQREKFNRKVTEVKPEKYRLF